MRVLVSTLLAASCLFLQACGGNEGSSSGGGSTSSSGAGSSSGSSGSSSGGSSGSSTAPTAAGFTRSLPEDGEASVVLRASGSGPITYTVVEQPTQGVLTGTPPNLTYTPRANYNGGDRFRFTASNASGSSAPASVDLTVTAVNDRPVAMDGSASTTEDQSVAITLTGSDVDGDTLDFVIVASPTQGTLGGSGASRTYTPNADYDGTDAFTYRVTDGSTSSATARVGITVTPRNDAPVARNLAVTLAEDDTFSFNLSATDADGDALRYDILVPPAHGRLSPNGEGDARRAYLPDPNFNGSDTLTYVARDATGTSSPATVDFTVTAVNDVPQSADQSVTVDAGATIGITLAGTDADGDALTYEISRPTAGTLTGAGPDVRYTAPNDGTVSAQFNYRVNDGTVDSAGSLVRITIRPITTGRALLGPLAGATVTVTPVRTRNGNAEADLALAPLTTGAAPRSNEFVTTTTGGSLAEAGFFAIPREQITDDPADIGAYLVTVAGGNDLDANDDGAADAVPTPNRGVLKALVMRPRLLQGNFNVNALTTALTDQVRLGLERESLRNAQAHLDSDAALMLGRDLDGSSGVDYLDALVFDPAQHTARLRRPVASFVAFSNALREGRQDVMASHRLLAPQLNGPTPVGALAVAVRGNLAYSVGQSPEEPESDFGVTDLGEPDRPRLLGRADTRPALPFDDAMALVGNTAWVSGSNSNSGAIGLFTVDFSDPAAPQPNPVLRLEGVFVQNIASRGNLLFGLFDRQLRAYDVSDASNPQLVGSFDAGGRCQRLLLDGNRAYVICNSNRLVVVDTSTPQAMTQLSSTALPLTRSSSRSGLALEGTRLALHQDGLPVRVQLFDVANPSAPADLGAVDADNRSDPFSLLMKDGRVYLGSLDQRVSVLDVRMPGAYSLLGGYRMMTTSARTLLPLGANVLAGSSISLEVIDPAAIPRSVAPLAALDALLISLPGRLIAFPDNAAQDGITFATAGPIVVDSVARSFVAFESVDAGGFDVSGDANYAAALTSSADANGNFSTRLRIVGAPEGGPRVQEDAFDNSTAIDAIGDYVSLSSLGDTTIAVGFDGLARFATDGGNVAGSRLVGKLALPRRGAAAVLFLLPAQGGGTRRYAAVLMSLFAEPDTDDLAIVDLDAGIAGTVVATRRLALKSGNSDCFRSVVADVNRADGQRLIYVGCGRASGLVTIDVSTPSAPAVRARLAVPRGVDELRVLDAGLVLPALGGQRKDLLLASEGGTGLRVVDIGNPDAPKTLEVIETYGPVSDVVLAKRSPLRLLTSESMGIVPLEPPFYSVR